MKYFNTYGQVLDLAVLIPTIQAYDLNHSSADEVTFIRGNGKKYLAIVSQNEITKLPFDGVTYPIGYTFSDGSYVIAKGISTTIDVSDLINGTWFMRIFEFNGFSGIEKYNRDEANNNPLEFIMGGDGIFDETFDETFE
jgi:hypothetical protein